MSEHQVGTTTDFALTRNELIELGYAKIGKLEAGQSLSEEQLRRGIIALNLLIRAISAKGIDNNKLLWAMAEDHLILQADKWIYGVQEGLSPHILQLETVMSRGTDSADSDMDIITVEQYEIKGTKNETGDPTELRFIQGRRPADNRFWVWPNPSSIGTTSTVVGTDSQVYSCILGHGGAEQNRPITGTDYPMFWKLAGTGTTAWAAGATYTNGELLRYTFMQLLFEFGKHSDNPDMPLGWDLFLEYSLALELAPENQIDLDTRRWLAGKVKFEKDALFPSSRQTETKHRDVTVFF